MVVVVVVVVVVVLLVAVLQGVALNLVKGPVSVGISLTLFDLLMAVNLE